MDRRHALMTFAAAGAGVLAGGAPEVARAVRPGEAPKRAANRPKRKAPPPNPSYARGKPVQAIRRPVHTLHDLTPAAPANAVALTIDDGPHPTYTPMLLDLLARYKVPATFSVIGLQVTEWPKLVQRIVAEGHQISGHTVTHPLNLPRLPAARIEGEIGGGHDRIAQTTGVAPKYFRAPGGAWSPQILDTAAAHSMICIDWQVDTRDWTRPGAQTIARRLLGAQPGDILLCHDGGGNRVQTIEALRTVIPALQQRGLAFVAL
jgi:peptidoglycan/xylan/chitin deacetylase (PgdA/CDA1 family)